MNSRKGRSLLTMFLAAFLGIGLLFSGQDWHGKGHCRLRRTEPGQLDLVIVTSNHLILYQCLAGQPTSGCPG